ALVALALAGCGPDGAPLPGDLLAGLAPTRVESVTDPARLTDGIVAREGDDWDTDRSSRFQGGGAAVEWDLGRVARIRGAILQGDNNDTFVVEASEDGQQFAPLWTARDVRGAGLRSRSDATLDVPARYVRLTARGGDAGVSATELALFENVPPAWPVRPRVIAGKHASLPGEQESLAFGLITALAVALHRQGAGTLERLLTVLLPALAGYHCLSVVSEAFPPGQPVIDMLRTVAAFVSLVAVIRVAFRPAGMSDRFVNGTLAAMALLAMTTFYNMWQPQFEHASERRQTWVHTWDMRVYFPTAKYFRELGFDGLYTASVAAYLEDAPGASERRVAHVELRDLRDYRMTTVEQVIDQVRTVKDRFSPERWTEFKQDMAFFWKTMGPGGYLGSLRDHGGNATPAWLLLAHVMFAHAPATEPVLLAAAALDPLLLALFFGVAWRTFGLRTALVAIVVYGTSTFPWFGSNWAGSTLRNDWMVLVGLGACALRAGRPATGGALLAGAAMIRAFPALAVFFLVVPTALEIHAAYRRDGRLPSARALLESHRPLVRAAAGATACVVIAFAASAALFGVKEAWIEWAHKISMHSVKPNINHVGLRTLLQYSPEKTLRALAQTGGDWSMEQLATLRSRKLLYWGLIGVYSAYAIGAARRRDLRQAALLGMMMIPVLFYPSNYYLHYFFVLPLLVDESEEPAARRLWGLVSAVVLAVSVSEYWGFDVKGVDERYVQWSAGAMIGIAAILWLLERDGRPAAGSAPAPTDAPPGDHRPPDGDGAPA
ncbi:MAG: discoidin domain-containing protein, partial [Deltaproteobacteria bacterium]|nr:discoidin domain-containing protein [Deltaproteobacteria bacterium]